MCAKPSSKPEGTSYITTYLCLLNSVMPPLPAGRVCVSVRVFPFRCLFKAHTKILLSPKLTTLSWGLCDLVSSSQEPFEPSQYYRPRTTQTGSPTQE